MSIKIKKIYQSILTTKKPITLITGGRGSSKSYTTSSLFCNYAVQTFQKILYLRYTMKTAEISIVPEFAEKIELIGAASLAKINGDEINFSHNSSQILFRGVKTSSGNQTANLKSLPNITTLIYDEFEEHNDEDSFDTIAYSIRSNQAQNRIVLLMNPSDVNFWAYKRWIENSCEYRNIDGVDIPISTHPQVNHIHTTYLDNIDNLPPEYIKSILSLKETDYKRYCHVFLGEWERFSESLVYKNWEQCSNTDYDNLDTVEFIGLDWGFTDEMAIIGVKFNFNTKQFFFKELFYKSGIAIKDYSAILESIGIQKGNTKIPLICDSEDPARIQYLQNNGYYAFAVKKPKVLERVQFLQACKCFYTESSVNVRKEKNQYCLDEFGKFSGVDHAMDSLSYGVWTMRNTYSINPLSF